MAVKRIPRPRDPIQLAKLIGDIATGQVVDAVDDGKDEAAAAMGRKGGASRAASMTPERRAEIAKKAAAKRWGK
jgi:ubiquinone biosynthesis protein UbiJ